MITVNQILHYKTETESFERILWIDEGNVIAYTIDIYNDELPIKRKICDINNDLKDGVATILEHDPFLKFIDEEQLSSKNKNIRESRWNAVKDIAKNEPFILDVQTRGKLIQNASDMTSTTRKNIYVYLKLYWKRGKNLNALLPDYHLSGGKGKDRKPSTKKLGRPRKHHHILGEGRNVDEEIKRVFSLSYKEFYLNQKENTMKTAYDLMVKKYFSEETSFENGKVFLSLADPNEIPTFTQFKYWLEKEINDQERLFKRKGRNKFALESREVLGSSTKESIGPCSMFQIDATVVDLYLVSRYNRQHVIGRPVLYIVMDVFSRMIVGVHVALEGPSWATAMMALVNAASDKVKFCKEYGIDINKEDWDCHHLPETLLADRGEIKGKNVESLISAFNIKVQNTAPYRGDWKGIVEQQFRTMHSRVKPFVPGYVEKDHQKRGGKDYRLDAKLDIYQFTQIIIKTILYHNNHHWMKGYDYHEMMASKDVEAIPTKLWEWGVQNRSGKLRIFPEEIVKLNLLPKDKATVTYRGIRFKKMFYTCDSAMKEYWFVTARDKGSWKIDISYDPRNMNFIYIRNNDYSSYETAFLLESKDQYANKTLDEIQYLHDQQELNEKLHEHKELEKKINLFEDIETIVEEAISQTDNAISYDSTSQRQKLKNIRENRKEEVAMIKNEESVSIQESLVPAHLTKMKPKPKTVIEAEIDDNENELASLLLRKQKERMNHRGNN